MNYIRQFDSIRAIAVILVIITHWFPETHKLNGYTSVFNGVDIFYTLSGFLITRILLENKEGAESRGTSKISLMRSFFVRRFLRIFPIYYLFICGLFLLGPLTGTGIRNSFPYFVTYTSNIYFFKMKSWDGMLSHLWSLSVEEQFYVMWPWLMLLVSRKYILPLIIAAVVVGIAGQLYLRDVPFGGLLTFCCLDGLGLGAFLAWMMVYQFSLLRKYYPVLTVLAIISCSIQIIHIVTGNYLIALPSRTFTAICTIWAITGIILNGKMKSIFFSNVLNNRVLVFLGKISYGIYLYHNILPHFTNSVFNRMNAYLPSIIYQHNFSLIQFENFCLLLLISYVSWKIIEQPILKLKKYFEYQKPTVSKYQGLRSVISHNEY